MGIRRLLRSIRRNHDEEEVREELRLHIDLETQDLLTKGLTPEEARRRALIAFGGLERFREEAHDVRRMWMLEAFLRDVRYGARSALNRPVFSLMVGAVIAVGTAGILAVFTLVHGILLRPLPYPDADRLVLIKHQVAGLKVDRAGISLGLYAHYREQARSFSSISLYDERVLNLRLPDAGTQRIAVGQAGVPFFEALGARSALGRLFRAEDARHGFMNTTWPIPVLLSHDFWVGQFGGDPTVIGRMLTINDRPREVVGVLAKGFAFPPAETHVWMLWEPSGTSASSIARNMSYTAVARLQPGVTVSDAERELSQLLPRAVGHYEDATPERLAELQLRPLVVPLKDAIVDEVAGVLWILFGAMGFLLLIAGANAAGLFLLRAEERRREIALRLALGASAHYVVRLFVAEALVLSGAGTALGLALAQILLSGTLAAATVELPRQGEIRLSATAVLVAVGVAVIMALFYGLLSLRPQGQSLRSNLNPVPMPAGKGWTRALTREPLIAFQIALALALMTGSALMLTTYRNLSRVDLGFSSDSMVTVDVGLPSSKAKLHARIYHDLVEQVRQIPGVQRAAAASFVPFIRGEHRFPVRAAGPLNAVSPPVLFKFFTPGYFETVRSPIAEGASVASDIRITARNGVLISAPLAKRLFPGERAIGKSLERLDADGTPVDLLSGALDPFTVVGVVGNVHETTPREGPSEIVYVPVLETPVEQTITPLHMTLLIRTPLSPAALMNAIRSAARATDPSLSLGVPRSMESIVESARARERFVGLMLLLASAVSLFLGIVGIYGTVAHRVGRRTREIGVRIALGATGREVVWMMVAGSMWSVAAGAALGVSVSFVTARALGSLLFGIRPADPAIFFAVTGLLLGAAMCAASLAARGAAGVAPAIALRAE